MRALLIFGLVIASATALVDPIGNYHEEVGIPLAAEIKLREEAFFKDQEERIVGGALAPTNAHPYFAGMLIDFVNILGQSVCGSSLLSSNRLVTAAHCWRDRVNQARQFTVILGTNFLYFGGTRIATSQVIMHPQWDTITLNNDVAMIYLPLNVVFSASISPIALPNTSELWNTFVGQWATAAGYGRTSDSQAGASTEVSHVSLQVINVFDCQTTYGSVHVRDTTICTSGAGGVGICGGDSGGPLSLFLNGRNVLIGVSSFVANVGCQLGHPSAYARTTSFNSFITQHL